jgi:hypothetical protein
MVDCKLALLGVLPQPMFFQRLLDLVVSNRWFLRSSNPCVAMAFAGAPFHRCLSSAFFKLRWTTNFGRKKTSKVLFNVILFSLRRCVSSCPSIVLPIVFLGVSLNKKSQGCIYPMLLLLLLLLLLQNIPCTFNEKKHPMFPTGFK